VEGGTNIEETNEDGMTALLLASQEDHFDIVVYLVEHGANAEHADIEGMTALLYAVENGHLQVVQYLLSSEGGASITETYDKGNTALLLAAKNCCHPPMVQWLLEYGGAQLTDNDNEGTSVCNAPGIHGLPHMLKTTYKKSYNGEYVFINGEYVPDGRRLHEDIVAVTAMLRVMLLHGGPPESLTKDLAPPFQQIVQDGARLRARLPAYLAQRRALLDAHCPLLPPLRDLVHGYEEPTTTDELWATGLGARLQRARRSRPERGQSPERRSARLRQRRL
jgi:hypothetical protein